MAEEWGVYRAQVAGDQAIFRVNLEPFGVAPIRDRKYLAWVIVDLASLGPDGSPSAEDEVALLMSRDHAAIFVAAVTTSRQRRLYFYLADIGQIERTVRAVDRLLPKSRVESGYREDAEWTYYLQNLYPSKAQKMQMDCAKIVRELQRRGDPLTVARTVTHYSYFPTQEDQERFSRAVAVDGFQIANLGKTTVGDLPYGVTFTSRNPVDLDTMVSMTSLLCKWAEQRNGEYDGWETRLLSR